MSRKCDKISPDDFAAGELVPVCDNLNMAQARNHRENAALLGHAKLKELWARMIKPVASVPSNAAAGTGVAFFAVHPDVSRRGFKPS